MRLRPVLEKFDVSYASSQKREGMAPYFSFVDANRNEKLKLLIQALQVLWLVVKLRPDTIITTGASPGYFAMLFGRLIGCQTIWLDSIANAEELSLSGMKAGRFASIWLTQWPKLADKEGGPAFKGRVL